jgi:hypothetical protein
MKIKQGFFIFCFKSEDDANLVKEQDRGCSEGNLLFFNYGIYTLFLTRIKLQKCRYKFAFRDYLFFFRMRPA